MKQKILTGWTWRRSLYAILGASLLIFSIIEKDWMGIIVGGYFTSMGVFAFGCAGGNCAGGACDTQTDITHTSDEKEPVFEEIKSL